MSSNSDLKSANLPIWKESVQTSTFSFFGVLSDVLHVFILIQFLTQEKIGVFFLSYAFLYLFSQIARGFGIAIRKRASEYNKNKSKYLWCGFILIVPSLILLYITLWIIQPVLNSYSSVTLSKTVLISLYFATTGFSILEFSRYYMAGCGEPARAEKLRTSIAKTSMPIITVILLSISPSVEYALYAVAIAYTGTAIIIFWITPHKLQIPSSETIVDVAKFSKWSVSTSVLNDFYLRWDTILLGLMVGSIAVGYYDSSVRIAFLATTFAAGVSKTSNVKMSGMNELNQDITDIADKTLEISTFLIFPLLITTALNAEYILNTIFGPAYTAAKYYLLLLIITQIFQAYRMQFESMFNSTNNPKITTKTSLICVVTNVLTAPVLVYFFGGYGVLYSTLLSELIRLTIYEQQIKTLLGQYIFSKGAALQYISALLLIGSLYIVKLAEISDVLFFCISTTTATIGFYTLQYRFSQNTQKIIAEYRT